MGWGTDPFGISPWGGAGGESQPPGGVAPTLVSIQPDVLEVEGGTVVTILGTGFFPEFVPMVFSGPPGGPYVLVAEGYLFDPDFDLTPSKALPGMPALPEGVYSLAVRTPAGVSNILDQVLRYLPFAEEERAQKGRSAWSQKWRVGQRWGA